MVGRAILAEVTLSQGFEFTNMYITETMLVVLMAPAVVLRTAVWEPCGGGLGRTRVEMLIWCWSVAENAALLSLGHAAETA